MLRCKGGGVIICSNLIFMKIILNYTKSRASSALRWKLARAGLIQAPKDPNNRPSGPLLAHPEKLQRGAEVGGEGGVDLDLLVGVKRIGEL